MVRPHPGSTRTDLLLPCTPLCRSEGRRALGGTLGFRPHPQLWIGRCYVRLGIGGYVGAILLVAAALLALALWAVSIPGLDGARFALFALIGFLPAAEVATALVNRSVTWSFGAVTLRALELSAGEAVSASGRGRGWHTG